MTHQVTNAAFIAIIEQHKGIIFKICNAYCRSVDDREDLTQEIIYQLLRSWVNYNRNAGYSTWIYRVALNVAISFYRTTKRTSNTVLLGDTVLEIEAEDNAAFEEDLLQLRTFIQELKALDRALMILYLDDKSYREIAGILSISESNVGTKINRIKSSLKQKFTNLNT